MAKSQGIYKPSSLKTQGFIHCSYPDQILKVANAIYHGEKDLVLLVIESNRVHANIREQRATRTSHEGYPHIYGALNLDSVVNVVSFEPNNQGTFELDIMQLVSNKITSDAR